MTPDQHEHRVKEPKQLLDLIYRARTGGLSRWLDDGREIAVNAIWHVPTVQGVTGVDAERFAVLLAGLEAAALIAPGAASYRTIIEAGLSLAAKRFAEHRPPGGPYEPARLLPTRRPRELIRRREDCACPLCGRPASWLRTRKGKRYEELRAVVIAEHACGDCSVTWTIYTEPVDEHGRYDPFADPVVCRPRWAYRSGYWPGARLAPSDHWEGT